jgi:hypothetical protein
MRQQQEQHGREWMQNLPLQLQQINAAVGTAVVDFFLRLAADKT